MIEIESQDLDQARVNILSLGQVQGLSRVSSQIRIKFGVGFHVLNHVILSIRSVGYQA